MIDVSVVIVSWNTREILRDCLESLRREGGGVCAEIIAVDNGSQDGSAEMVVRDFPEVRLIRNEDNRGFAAANNQGIAIAQGRYVLLLNSDTVVLDCAVAKAVAFADARPEVGIVGCRTLSADGSLQWNCFMFPSLLNLALSLTRLNRLFPRSRFFARQRFTWWDHETPRVVDAVAGCFMLARREAIADAGPMAEDYFMYSEDTDWCWRFRLKGWSTMYTPDATIVHLREASSSQCAAQMHIRQRRSLLMFLERKSGKWTRRLANAMFALSSLIRLCSLAMARLVSQGKAANVERQWELSAATLRFHLLGQGT